MFEHLADPKKNEGELAEVKDNLSDWAKEDEGNTASSEAKDRRTIKVSERAYRTLHYASRCYRRSIERIVEKLLDAPLNITTEGQPAKKPVETLESGILRKGYHLLKDLDPEQAEKCREELNDIFQTDLDLE